MKTSFLGLLLLMVLVWGACSSDSSDDPTPDPQPSAGTLTLENTAFPTTGSAGMALTKLKSSGPWVVEIEESAKSWVTVVPASGEGGEAVNVKVYVKRNLESKADFRKAVLVFKQTADETVKEEYTITQYTDYYLQQDSLVLVKIFDRLGGKNWLRPWDFSTPVSTWEGVTINTVDGKNRIALLEFRKKMNLSGTIPDELAELTELISFGFTSEEGMTGNIPESLKKTPLQMLQITNCPNIGGLLPSYLQGWETLQHFVVSGCSFYGIDEEWTGNFPSLLSFLIDNNKFTGPLELRYVKDMPKLVLAEFKNNDFEGKVPTALFAGKPMYAFTMRMNRFTGAFPEAIKVMPAFEDSISDVKSKDDVCPQQEGYGFDAGTCNDNYVSD